MNDHDYGERYGYVMDWDEFKSETPYIEGPLIRLPCRPPRLSRLSLAMLVCANPSFPNPPKPVLIFKPTKQQRQVQ